MSSTRTELARFWRRSARYRPASATGWIIAVTVAAYVVQILTAGALEDLLAYRPAYSLPRLGVPLEPWRMLTAALIHQPIGPGAGIVGLAHIGFNMYALVLFGRPLENVMGAGRLLAIYWLSVLAGSVAVLLWFTGLAVATGDSQPLGTEVYGASGGVFGVLGAVVVVQRRLGVDVRSLLIMIGINFAIPFLVRTIAWQAHLGGLAVGALLGWLFITNRGPRRTVRAWAATGAVTAALLVLAIVPAVLVP